jgi:hypothetical protein
MHNPYDIWAVKYDGKRMHIEYATRLPRKLKKFVKTIYDMMEDSHNDFIVVSPSFGKLTEEWVSSSKDLANGKSVSSKNSGLLHVVP